MSDYEFQLPWPPTVNHFHQPVMIKGRTRNIKSKGVKAYHKQVKILMDKLGLSGEMIEERVSISLVMHPKTNHKYDCSNFLKAYEDALVECKFLEDDHWIEYDSIKKGEKVKGGMLEVKVNRTRV